MANALAWCNRLVWGMPTLLLFVSTGVFFSCSLRLPQLTRVRDMCRTVVQRKKGDTEADGVSPFQSMCTALAASIGTGNIIGVCAALSIGGAGAVFWMLVSAFFGQATAYAENALGVVYRERSENGAYLGGAMYTIRAAFLRVFSPRIASFAGNWYAVLCCGAALGMGNAVQVNAAAVSLQESFHVPVWVTGLLSALLVGLLLLRGNRSVVRVTEKMIPPVCVLFLLTTITVVIFEIKHLPAVLLQIITGAFGMRAMRGGFSGAALKKAIEQGMVRGVFSNEAGLGTSVAVHAAAGTVTPYEQGLRSMAEVLFDTGIMCSLTAFCVLGVPGASEQQPAAMLSFALAARFGALAEKIVGLSITVFAVGTLLGWSFYGSSSAQYVGGKRAEQAFAFFYAIAAFYGATMPFDTVWSLSDLMNGLLAFPNLYSLLLLQREVRQTLPKRKQK